jgi:hypothetical protein
MDEKKIGRMKKNRTDEKNQTDEKKNRTDEKNGSVFACSCEPGLK